MDSPALRVSSGPVSDWVPPLPSDWAPRSSGCRFPGLECSARFVLRQHQEAAPLSAGFGMPKLAFCRSWD